MRLRPAGANATVRRSPGKPPLHRVSDSFPHTCSRLHCSVWWGGLCASMLWLGSWHCFYHSSLVLFAEDEPATAAGLARLDRPEYELPDRRNVGSWLRHRKRPDCHYNDCRVPASATGHYSPVSHRATGGISGKSVPLF